MTEDDIIPSRTDVLSMAREAGATEWCPGWHLWTDDLERFAALIASWVAAKEREACAKVCDDLNFIDNGTPEGTRASNRHCAAAIRSRSIEHCARGEI